MTTRPTALVTGATAGIGAAFAKALAAGGYDLVLVARDRERLEKAATDLGATHSVLVADLATDDGCALVEQRLSDVDNPVDLLVNNAGIGLRGAFRSNGLEAELRQLDLNVRAVLRLTHAALGPMVERRRGAIVNVSSVAGFATTAPGSTYGATKSWVTAFSESVHLSVRLKGVRVMALCPGYVRTEFHERAGIDVGDRGGPMWLDADRLVATALADLRRGRTVSVPSVQYKAIVGLLRHAPRSLLNAVLTRSSRARD
ncbi:SDR family NAD(P)-dependent oxidoreductase [Fodinicola acaciae]|uniref:SDR family NAD(P)-dependent oxidoreductase n=1 Tax=Fodinicola acaciae TaxID=2681555 RepID=UPI0013D30A15|nr:SDR family NAD(P)-dependent oxidoreductase [Fodinicola acaciae]